MGDVNQLAFVEKHKHQFKGPYLEVGSKDYGAHQNVRGLVEPGEYVGIDMLAGDGVDHVLDLTSSFEEIDTCLGGRKFNTIFCLSVLEHCTDPAAMCRSMTYLLNPGGVVYISVPFIFKFHGYPSDYWRFTPEGVKVICQDLTFDPQDCVMSTEIPGDVHPLDRDMLRARFSVSEAFKTGFFRGLSTIGVKIARTLRLAPWLLGHRYLFPPVMLHMIGKKPE
jgi:hypothetical protein